MKKLKTLLLLSMLALVVGGLSSCSSDDDDSPKFNDVTVLLNKSPIQMVSIGNQKIS